MGRKKNCLINWDEVTNKEIEKELKILEPHVTSNFLLLCKIILERSTGNSYNIVECLEEWTVKQRLPNAVDFCECSHDTYERYLMVNKLNANKICPIGNECIKNFNNERLNEELKELRKVKCEVCNVEFANSNNLKRHEKSDHHLKMLKKRYCERCKKELPENFEDWKKLCIKCYKA
jgi:hypothetical protein